jgi:SAM-dependent methyltransferase
MGDRNQLLIAQRFLGNVTGPVVEVGSKDYGNTQPFRQLFAGLDYVGVDVAPGDNVDRVVDLESGLGDLAPGTFGLVICCSVLEHMRRPWRAAENLSVLLRPGGSLFISVPWVWRYHAYPDDYYRFSASALRALFPRMRWRAFLWSSSVEGEIVAIDEAGVGLDDRAARFLRGRGLNGRWSLSRRKYLPYLMVNGIGELGAP